MPNLKNKTGAAFVSKFLYENRHELSTLCKVSKDTNINYFQQKPKNEKKFHDKKRKKIPKKIYLDQTNDGKKKSEREERRKKYSHSNEIDLAFLRGISSKSRENT